MTGFVKPLTASAVAAYAREILENIVPGETTPAALATAIENIDLRGGVAGDERYKQLETAILAQAGSFTLAGAITSFTISNGGTNYVVGDQVLCDGSADGIGGAGVVSAVAGGVITAVDIVAGGANYLTTDTCTVLSDAGATASILVVAEKNDLKLLTDALAILA